LEAFMDTGDKVAHVTQGEFYGALALVWLFIALAFSMTGFNGSPSLSIANVIYLAVSVMMGVNYTVKTWRGDASPKRSLLAVLLAAAALIVGAVAFFAR
jgi:hypothetical protein